MDCAEARPELNPRCRARLAAERAEALERHLASCPACAQAARAEAELDALLASTLPARPAPPALRQRLEAMVSAAATPAPEPGSGPPEAPSRAARARRWARRELRWQQLAAPALAAAVAAAVVLIAVDHQAGRAGSQAQLLAQELVSDHLRALVAEHPLDLVSSANHQLKPWFEGRLDFAPTVPAPEVPDLRLDGGAVGYVLDRKAAVITYHLRRHAVTLLAFRADGLGGAPPRDDRRPPAVRAVSVRGFQVALWRAGDVGYALVSDVAGGELRTLAERFAAASAD